MRWAPSITTGIACLILGFVAGYFLPRQSEHLPRDTNTSPKAQNPANTKPVYASTFPNSSSVPGSGTAAQSSSKDVLRSLPAADDYKARSEWLQKVPAADLPQLIAALCENPGPEGISNEDRRVVESALEKWWAEDSAGLLAWLRKFPNGATKRFLVSELIEDVARNDRPRAKAMASSFKAADPEWNNSEVLDSFAWEDINEAWKKPGVTAEKMLGLYKSLSGKSDAQTYNTDSYPAGFDFRTFLDGVNEIGEGKDGRWAGTWNLISAWAKEDPQAAASWLIDRKNEAGQGGGSHFMGWRQIAKGVSERNGPQAYHQWASEMVAQFGDKVRQMILDESSDEDLAGIMENMTDQALRTEVSLSQAVRRGDIDLFAMFSTPEQRLGAIAKDPRIFRRWIERGKTDPSFWSRAGLTPEQVAAVIPETPDTPPPICPHCGTAHY
jgi:hypothetical protein